MKKLLIAILTLLVVGVKAQQMSCNVPDRVRSIPNAEKLSQVPSGVLCSKVFVQVDYGIVSHFGLQSAKREIEGLMQQVAIPFRDIDVELSYTFQYLLEPTYTPGSSYDMLLQFQQQTHVFDGDVAMLLYLDSSGGIAWLDVSCKDTNPYKYAFSNIQPNYRPYLEGYSWSVHVVAHELGHSYGSPHTHDNVWNGNNTPIDGCVGGPGPLPTDGGTIMSYCHLNSVGVNFEKGFHPQVAEVIRASIYDRCATCESPPDDDPDPPVLSCTLNTVFLNIILDAFPSQTSFDVRDAFGGLVFERGPFPDSLAGAAIYDTLCLENGCYTFTIKDKNGLAPHPNFPCSEGMWYVGDPFGEFGSGQDFAGMVDVRFCVGSPSQKCDEITLNADSLISFANQDQVGGISVAGEGFIQLYGNTWKAQHMEYTVTDQTVLTGRVQIERVGEIHGVSIVKNVNNLSLRNTIQFGGKQPWGTYYRIEGVESGNWVNIEIPIGQLIVPGDYSYIVLINDHDVENPNAKTGFREFEFCEQPGAKLNSKFKQLGKMTDESRTEYTVIVEDIILRPYPNPVADTLNLKTKVFWELYSPVGLNIMSGYSKSVSFIGLVSGVYTLKVGNKAYKIVKL